MEKIFTSALLQGSCSDGKVNFCTGTGRKAFFEIFSAWFWTPPPPGTYAFTAKKRQIHLYRPFFSPWHGLFRKKGGTGAGIRFYFPWSSEDAMGGGGNKRGEENLTKDTPPKTGFWAPFVWYVFFPPPPGFITLLAFLYNSPRLSRPEAFLEVSRIFREGAFIPESGERRFSQFFAAFRGFLQFFTFSCTRAINHRLKLSCSAELEFGNAAGAFVQTQHWIKFLDPGHPWVHNFHAALGWGLAAS